MLLKREMTSLTVTGISLDSSKTQNQSSVTCGLAGTQALTAQNAKSENRPAEVGDAEVKVQIQIFALAEPKYFL